MKRVIVDSLMNDEGAEDLLKIVSRNINMVFRQLVQIFQSSVQVGV